MLKLNYARGALVVNEEDGNVSSVESPYITLPNNYLVEQDIDGDFEDVNSKDGAEVTGDVRNKMLDQHESYIADCIDAMADDYVSILKESRYYADKEVITVGKEFYNANRGNYEVIHWVTSNVLIVTYSDYHENFFRKRDGQ